MRKLVSTKDRLVQIVTAEPSKYYEAELGRELGVSRQRVHTIAVEEELHHLIKLYQASPLSTMERYVCLHCGKRTYSRLHLCSSCRREYFRAVVLQCLATNRTMTPSQIAEWTLRGKNTITTLINRLRRDGFVDTERSDRDGRSINVTLTKKGRKVLRQATPAAREIVNQVMSSISEGEAISLEQSLRVLRQNAYRGLEKGHEGESQIRKTLV